MCSLVVSSSMFLSSSKPICLGRGLTDRRPLTRTTFFWVGDRRPARRAQLPLNPSGRRHAAGSGGRRSEGEGNAGECSSPMHGSLWANSTTLIGTDRPPLCSLFVAVPPPVAEFITMVDSVQTFGRKVRDEGRGVQCVQATGADAFDRPGGRRSRVPVCSLPALCCCSRPPPPSGVHSAPLRSADPFAAITIMRLCTPLLPHGCDDCVDDATADPMGCDHCSRAAAAIRRPPPIPSRRAPIALALSIPSPSRAFRCSLLPL